MGNVDITSISGLFAKLMDIVKAILAALKEGEASSIIGIIGGFFNAGNGDDE